MSLNIGYQLLKNNHFPLKTIPQNLHRPRRLAEVPSSLKKCSPGGKNQSPFPFRIETGARDPTGFPFGFIHNCQSQQLRMARITQRAGQEADFVGRPISASNTDLIATRL